ncbi:MAG: class I SAM-dependent methyltransferase [Deltaproteobacteria bacterium]|nr:class I SAM-dependent methyltransferase [Deltaproteobacteria bacterium]MBN2671028.1 class I SAM-dependent methyltransferase [Deltaproteobacteria bacterium]
MSHFNAHAEQWDDNEKIHMMKILAERTIEALQSRNKLSQKHHIIDFGCGTGLFGLELMDIAKTLTGVDTSEGMLAVFNQKTSGNPDIRSVLIDLENETTDITGDLIVSSMAFHHLADPRKMLGTLVRMLNPGGAVVLVDLDSEDGSFHPDNAGMGVKHFGFTKSTVSDWAQTHNLRLQYSVIHEVKKNNRAYPIFLAVFERNDQQKKRNSK